MPTPPENTSFATTVEVRRHDRMNLEIKVHHRCPDATADERESIIDVWWFIPHAVGVNPSSYHAADFYRDLRAHPRLTTPTVSLETLAHPSGQGSPLASLGTLLARAPAGGSTSRMEQGVRHEARMLVCMYRRAARDAAGAMPSGPGADFQSNADSIVVASRSILRDYRAFVERLLSRGVSAETRFTLATCDEALSVEVEAVLTRMVDERGSEMGESRSGVAALAREERELRELRGDRSGARPDAPDAEERARFWDQASLLKKYVSQALFLNPKSNSDARKLEHIAKAVAAALAMVWTVSLQIVSIRMLGLEMSSRVDLRAIVLFATVAILGYILKDRIKDTVGKRLAASIPRLLYDRRLDLFLRDSESAVGQVREQVRFEDDAALPAAVQARRELGARDPLAARVPHDALHYQRRVTALPRQAAAGFARMSGITDILRVNLLSWTRTLDSRHKSVVVLDEDDEAAEARVPNRYVVDVVIRVEDPGGVRLESWRLHLTRRGLQQVCRVQPDSARHSHTLRQTAPEREATAAR